MINQYPGQNGRVDAHLNNEAIRNWAPANQGLDGGLIKHSKRVFVTSGSSKCGGGKPVEFAHKIAGTSHRVVGDHLGEWTRGSVATSIYRARLVFKISDVEVAFLLALLLLLVLSQLCAQRLKFACVSSAGWRLRWPMVYHTLGSIGCGDLALRGKVGAWLQGGYNGCCIWMQIVLARVGVNVVRVLRSCWGIHLSA